MLETLKRIYLEADGDEEKMLEAIRGLKRHVGKNSLDVTESEWQYIERMCPGAIVDLLKNLQNGSQGATQEPNNAKSRVPNKDPGKGERRKKKK